MKKFLLFSVIAMLVGCVDYTDDFNAIDERLDKLEQVVPSIEEQIESINAQLTSLKATDDAIKEQISELEKSNNATASEIADLKKKDLALEKSINDLQNYVDTQITNAKSEAAAAYATIEQYNTIVAQLNALQSSTSKLGEELTAKINAEVKSLNTKIADLEARLKAVEDKVESLLARIQSVSYIPEYTDGKVVVTRMGSTSSGELSFRISPKDAVVELEKVWSEALSCEAYYPKTRAVSLVKLTVTEYVADAESGVITVKISGEGLSEEFFAGTQEAKVALVISDGNNQVVSDYADAVGKEIIEEKPANNEIWYTSTDENIVTPYATDVFGANIVSNTYENGQGVITFDGDVTLIGDGAFTECTSLTSVSIPNSVISFGHSIFAACESLEAISGQFVSKDSRCLIINGELNSFAPSGLTTYAVPYSVTSIGYYAFCGCSSLTSITIPDSVTSLENRSFWFCTSLASITIPNGVTKIGENAFYNCSNLTSVYCKSTTPPIGNESMFNDNASERKIYVPHNSVEAYKTAEYWSNYASDIVGYDF